MNDPFVRARYRARSGDCSSGTIPVRSHENDLSI